MYTKNQLNKVLSIYKVAVITQNGLVFFYIIYLAFAGQLAHKHKIHV